MKPGARVSFGDGLLKGEVLEVVEEGNRLIHFEYEGIFEEILDQLGQMPLPPYITPVSYTHLDVYKRQALEFLLPELGHGLGILRGTEGECARK